MLKTKYINIKKDINQINKLLCGEKKLTCIAILIGVLSYLSETVGFGLMILIIESTLNASGFDKVPLIGWISQLIEIDDASLKLRFLAMLLIIVTIMRGGLLYVAEIASYSIPPRVEMRLKIRVLDCLYKMPIGYVECKTAGELSNLTAGLPARIGASARFFQLFITNSLILAVNAIVMAIISPVITAIILASFGALGYVYKKLTVNKLKYVSAEIGEANSQFGQLFYNMLNGIRSVRLSGGSIKSKTELVDSIDRMKVANLKRLTTEATVYPFFTTVIGLIFSFLLVLASFFDKESGAALMASMLTTIYLMTRMMGPITYINVSRINIQANSNAFDELSQFFDSADKHYEIDGNIDFEGFVNKIQFDNVSFAYQDKDVNVLNGVSFELFKGERLGIIGTSGSGKSTITLLLCRIIRPLSGEIKIDAINLNDYKVEGWWERIAIVLQDVVLHRETIRENLLQGLKYNPSDEEIWKALDAVELTTVIENNCGGLDALLSERGLGLSGGERQRLGLARALLRKPELLILDESTSNLDVYTEAKIVHNLKRNYSHITMLVVAHRIGAIEVCDRVLVVNSGRIVRQYRREEFDSANFKSLEEFNVDCL